LHITFRARHTNYKIDMTLARVAHGWLRALHVILGCQN
jgi:hypothetical protein